MVEDVPKTCRSVQDFIKRHDETEIVEKARCQAAAFVTGKDESNKIPLRAARPWSPPRLPVIGNVPATTKSSLYGIARRTACGFLTRWPPTRPVPCAWLGRDSACSEAATRRDAVDGLSGVRAYEFSGQFVPAGPMPPDQRRISGVEGVSSISCDSPSPSFSSVKAS